MGWPELIAVTLPPACSIVDWLLGGRHERDRRVGGLAGTDPRLPETRSEVPLFVLFDSARVSVVEARWNTRFKVPQAAVSVGGLFRFV